jgi:septum formation protein
MHDSLSTLARASAPVVPQVILASASPRRRDLLRQIGIRFDVAASNVNEDLSDELSPVETALLLAELKARVIAKEHPSALVIGCDTVINLDGELIGKPTDAADAERLLALLSGRTHQAITAVALLYEAQDRREVFHVTTDVTFGTLSRELIEWYVSTGEPLDKAGAYGIQGAGAILVSSILGSYSNVVGLPLHELVLHLDRITGCRHALSQLHGALGRDLT